jgi:four helix bundle protein
MDDFTQFDAFEGCREFARGIAGHLRRGAFSQDPVSAGALQKTLLSIYSSFGEGFERDGNREFAQFVSIAKGSIGETRAQLIYALDFGYLKPETFSDLDQLGKTAATCLGGLIRYLNDSSFRERKFKNRDDLRNQSKPLIRSRQTPNKRAPAERRTPNAKRILHQILERFHGSDSVARSIMPQEVSYPLKVRRCSAINSPHKVLRAMVVSQTFTSI